MGGTVIFNHGSASGPWGDKITRLAEVARAHGFAVESIDCTGIDDPQARVEKLRAVAIAAGGPLVLAGSSMGGYVAAAASQSLKPQGLFLMAPAFYIADYPEQEPVPVASEVVIVHGWNDQVVPIESSLRYARKFKAQLHCVDSDHRLSSQLPFIAALFGTLLNKVSSGEYS